MYGELLKRLWMEQGKLQSFVAQINDVSADSMKKIEIERKLIMDQLRGSYQRLEKLDAEVRQLMAQSGEPVPEKLPKST